MVIWTLVNSTEALAGEQNPRSANPGKPDFDEPLKPGQAADFTMHPQRHFDTRSQTLPPEHYLILPSFAAPELPLAQSGGARDFSAHDLRNRSPSARNDDERVAANDGPPTLTGSTVWQRLSQYRTYDRVRVVTLWETGSSSVSLQAGRRGDPSLQWISRAMNRGGATRGLLDQLLENSLGRVAKTLHLGSHASVPEVPGSATKSSEAAAGVLATP